VGQPPPAHARLQSLRTGETDLLVPFGPSTVNPYVLLAAAILSELVGTTALKLSEGFTRPIPSMGVVVGYGAAFYLVSLVLEDLPVGVVYGTWAAMGVVGVAAIGAVVFDEPVDPVGLVGLALIVAGVYCVNVLSGMAAH